MATFQPRDPNASIFGSAGGIFGALARSGIGEQIAQGLIARRAAAERAQDRALRERQVQVQERGATTEEDRLAAETEARKQAATEGARRFNIDAGTRVIDMIASEPDVQKRGALAKTFGPVLSEFGIDPAGLEGATDQDLLRARQFLADTETAEAGARTAGAQADRAEAEAEATPGRLARERRGETQRLAAGDLQLLKAANDLGPGLDTQTVEDIVGALKSGNPLPFISLYGPGEQETLAELNKLATFMNKRPDEIIAISAEALQEGPPPTTLQDAQATILYKLAQAGLADAAAASKAASDLATDFSDQGPNLKRLSEVLDFTHGALFGVAAISYEDAEGETQTATIGPEMRNAMLQGTDALAEFVRSKGLGELKSITIHLPRDDKLKDAKLAFGRNTIKAEDERAWRALDAYLRTDAAPQLPVINALVAQIAQENPRTGAALVQKMPWVLDTLRRVDPQTAAGIEQLLAAKQGQPTEADAGPTSTEEMFRRLGVSRFGETDPGVAGILGAGAAVLDPSFRQANEGTLGEGQVGVAIDGVLRAGEEPTPAPQQ